MGLRPQTAKNWIESADASSLRSFAPAVSMMKAAEPGTEITVAAGEGLLSTGRRFGVSLSRES